ncbi:MAG: FxSxx-COOH system tetratricopeptide repeat protein [Ktedonobacteraceae bacterium]
MSVSAPSRAITLFISYAGTSSKDAAGFDELMKHLSLLFLSYPTVQCYNSMFSDKSPTNPLNEAHLNQADIIILLTSADFFAAKQREMQRALALTLRDPDRTRVVSVQLEPTDWNSSPLSAYSALPTNNEAISLWPNRDAAFTDVVQGIRLAVEDISQRTRPAQPPSQSVIIYDPPDAYDNLFTDRKPILDAIAAFFSSTHAGQTALLTLSGLGGSGKTAIARYYCDQASGTYQDILWLNASSRAMLSTYMNALADQLALPDAVRDDEQQFFDALKQWLRDRPRWLLVLDQVRDVALVNLIVPPYSRGHVILTMRTQDTWKRGRTFFVPSMSINDGALLLLRRAQILSAQAPLEQAAEEVAQQAREIARVLDGFPLALDQAGAFLRVRGGGLANYLTLFKDQPAYLLSTRVPTADSNQASVTEILAPTLDALRNTPQIDLLRLMSFLHPDVIIRGLLMNGWKELREPLRSLLANPLTLHEALGALHHSSLVRYQDDGTILQIQRIVQDVLVARLTMQQRRYWAQQAVRLVNRAFPEVRFDTRAICERYLPQAEHCAILIADYQLTLKEGALLLERLGSFCSRRASYGSAETYLTQALHIYERHRRKDVLNMVQTLNSLGLLYHQQARYKEAEALHQRALEQRERVLGEDDPKTMESLHNLTLIYAELGKYQAAELLYQRVLSVEERAKGPDHSDVADTLNELGLIYTQQGRTAEAETAFRRALAIYEHARDANDPDLTYPLDGLGTLAEMRGDYLQAEVLYQQALAICESAFGEMHPETSHSMRKLAGNAASQGNHERAENLYERALSISEQTLGPGHPDVALVLNDQGRLATSQGQYQRAEPFYQRALRIYELILGPEHPAVASVLTNLGQLSRMTGNKEEAEKLLQRALAIREKTLDPMHPSIAESLSNLTDLRNEQ